MHNNTKYNNVFDCMSYSLLSNTIVDIYFLLYFILTTLNDYDILFLVFGR